MGVLDHGFCEAVRFDLADKATEYGVMEAAMLRMAEIELMGIVEKLKVAEERLIVRPGI